MSHHDLLRLVRAESRRFLLANGIVLFYVIFVPFPTAVLAANLTGSEASAAVTFYCGAFVAGSAAWYLLLAAITHDRLFGADVDPHTIGHLRRNQRIGLLVYIAATLLAPALPWLALTLNVAVRVLWLRVRYETAPSLEWRVRWPFRLLAGLIVLAGVVGFAYAITAVLSGLLALSFGKVAVMLVDLWVVPPMASIAISGKRPRWVGF